MGDRYMITDGRRTCFLELENLRVGAIVSTNVWRQHKPFNKSLLENITGSWSFGNASGFVERAPAGYGYQAPQLRLSDPSGRVIMEFQSMPGDDAPTTGEIIRPDGWRDKVTLSKVKYNVDLARAWMGLALKGGGQVLLLGEEIAVGSLWNLGTDQLGFPFATAGARMGPGLGASGGIVMCFAYGFRDAQAALGTEYGGLDFSVSLGERWSSLVKAGRLANAKTGATVMALIRTLTQVRASNLRSLSALMQVTSRFVHSEGAINLFKNVIGLSSFDDTTRTLVTFDVPMASGGLELSIFKTSGKIVAVDMASTQKYLEELTSAGPAGRQDRVGDPRRPLY